MTLTTHSGVHGSHSLWLSVVNGIIGAAPRNWLLDLCCGGTAITRHLDFKRKVGVDVEDHPERDAEFDFTQQETLEFLLRQVDPPVSLLYDVAIISDGIEHFTLHDAKDVLLGMEAISNLVIVFVPTNDIEITPDSTDPHAHKSAWWPELFQALGYETNHFPDWHAEKLELGACFAWKRVGHP